MILKKFPRNVFGGELTSTALLFTMLAIQKRERLIMDMKRWAQMGDVFLPVIVNVCVCLCNTFMSIL